MEKKGITLETIEHILGKKIPWILGWPLKKLLHLEEINTFLSDHGDETGMQFLNSALKFLDIEIKIIGNLEIDKNSRCCIVCNHPFGGIDGLAMLSIIAEKSQGDVKVIVNSFLAKLPGLSDFVVPVNVLGGTNENGLIRINETFEGNSQILMFPAQLCSRKQHGKIKDLPWKKRFLQNSIKYNRTVIPVYIDGGNSKSFYFFAKLSKFLSIVFKKPNLEKLAMILLPHEMMKNRGKKFQIRIVIGKPMNPQRLIKHLKKHDNNYSRAAQSLGNSIYNYKKRLH